MCSGRFFRDIWNSFFCCWNRETKINKSARLAYKARRDVRLEELYLNSTPRQLADSAHEDHFRISGIRTEEGILETFRSVLDLDLMALRDALYNKTYTAVTVLHAFVWRALDINKELNCITQIVESSFEAARSLDEKDGMDPRELPLYGLPFSVKSNMAVSGCPMTLGFAKRSNHNSSSTCPMVQFLCDLGAIPFCLTNVPQGILSYVTSNPLDGFTRNPWDLERTPGGSSGGEAALLAAGGASFGVGNDLGGSLRIPAAFCGLVTLKPSEHRLFTTKTEGGLPGKGPLGLSHGFFTRNVEEQEFLLSCIVGREDYCTLCPQTDRLEWKKLRDKGGKLNITYFTSDEYMPPVPSSVRAVIETIEALRSDQRFNVMEPISIREIAEEERIESLVEMFFRNVMPDNGECARDMYTGEKSAKHMELFIGLLRLKPSRLVQWLTSGCLIGCVSKKFAVLATSFNWGPRGVRENQAKTEVFRERWMEYMRVNRIDAIICPAFITPAQGFHYPQLLAGGTFLTGLFNMLDVPAGVVPVGHVTEKDIENLKNPDIFKINGDFLLKKQKETCMGTEGLPIAVQVVTLPQQEELCVYVMKSVEEKMIGNVEKLEWVEEGELKNRFSKIPSKTREAPGNLEIWTNDVENEENEENESLKLNLEENTVHWTQKLKVGFVNEGYCGTGPSTPQNEHRSTSASPRKQLGRAQSLCRIEF